MEKQRYSMTKPNLHNIFPISSPTKDNRYRREWRFQLKGPVNIFNKIIEDNFCNLKKEMSMKIQEAYKTPGSFEQKRNSSHHIIVKTPNAHTHTHTK